MSSRMENKDCDDDVAHELCVDALRDRTKNIAVHSMCSLIRLLISIRKERK